MFTRRQILYGAILTILGITIIYGVAVKNWNARQDEKEIQDVNFELINEWITYLNSSNSYQYGVNLNVSNTGQSNLVLSNLQLCFNGIGRDTVWNATYPIHTLELAPGESEKVNVRSENVPVSSLGFIGDSESTEYLDLATNLKNLGLTITLEGIASSIDETITFSSQVKGLGAGAASASELVYARDLTNLGLTPRWLKRWLGTFSYLPVQDLFKYQEVQQGVIGTSKIPLIVVARSVHSRYQSVSLGIEDVRTLTVTDTNPPKVYYLLDRGYEFESYLKDQSLIDGESVYFYGDAYDYLAQDGTHYTMLFPSDINQTEIHDPLTIAKSFIVSKAGEDYYEQYYSDPFVEYRPGQVSDTYVATWIYHITVGNYTGNQTLYLFFDQDWNLTDGEHYLPVEGNLQPFTVTEEEAREIAINAGISDEPYGIWAGIGNTGIIRDQTSEYQGKYMWQVGTWIDPPGANPRRNINAIIDPISGELYAIVEGGIGYIG
ncbi:MAG: hypothetical protein NWF07_11830 [Candidatus Bathyarchaeota archaeon]|nr:hypothetical protein [Candidatus Bathyarchaeota archaeon]